jgi:hypothetical protein
MPYNSNGEFYSDIPSRQGGAGNEMMQMFKDAIDRSANAKYRSGAQAAIGQANAIGGVYGNQLSQNTTLAGQNLQAKAEEDRNALGVGTLDVARGQLGLEDWKSKQMVPLKGVGVGAAPAVFDIKKAMQDYLAR